MNSPKDLRSEILAAVAKVKQYERKDLQEKAVACIPLPDLTRRAQVSMVDAANASSARAKPLAFRDFLLLELLHWFKDGFFTWVDTLPCSQCNSKTETSEMGTATQDEASYGASRVELHVCPSCGHRERFPRYNHPGKLLETRRGRCGEWANCFTLCCRALSFDARFVLDWTDHVWTEVYSDSQGCWLHCDPCEDVCDAPLIYEIGWGKKLSYVFAFSSYEVQDVTWRYTTDFATVLSRRTLYPESEVIDVVLKVTSDLQEGMAASRRTVLMLRRVQELADLLTPRKASDNERQGRISGSLAWRQRRGEMLTTRDPHVFRPTNSDCRDFTLKYSVSKDTYIVLENGAKVSDIEGWQNGVFSEDKVFRKVESDWKMAYLARWEGHDKGSILWKLDFTSSEAVEAVAIACKSATFENGQVRWLLCSEDSCVRLHCGDSPQVVSCLKGAQVLTLKAEIEGGRGSNAWQHAQLFREPLGCSVPSLEITVTLVQKT